MPSPWVWSAALHNYRNTRTGRSMGVPEMLTLRDQYIVAKQGMASQLAMRLAQGDMTVGQWQAAMRADIKSTIIDEYALGHGGRKTMTQAEWGRVSGLCREQYRYLDGFARAVADDTLSEAQIRARSIMYHDGAGVHAFEYGRSQALGVPKLPAYPGDGSTVCLSNCRCHWDIQPVEGGWDCYWLTAGGKICPDCTTNASKWSPLEVRV
jgi:hypothetical protein